MNSRYIVMEAGAKRVGKFGNYIRVAVVELDPSFEGRPTMISERAKGVKRIVRLWISNTSARRTAARRPARGARQRSCVRD